MRRLLVLALLAGALAVTACGRGSGSQSTTGAPSLGRGGGDQQAAQALGFPDFATKNTTRVGGADPVADAAGVARAVFPAAGALSRPRAVVLADKGAWQAALAASVLMAPPVRAPLLFTDGKSLPAASADALAALDPLGSDAVGGGQVVRIGGVARPKGLRATSIAAGDPYAAAAAIDRVRTAVAGAPSAAVVVTTGESAAYAMPAAAWAAKSGDPVLFTKRDDVPAATITALRRHQRARIFVLGPRSVIGSHAVGVLRRYGTVTRISGPDPVTNAIAFARFRAGDFGWGVVDPGHGLVFASPHRPLDAAAAAPLSASGTYGPLLLTDPGPSLPKALAGYLLDIQPGYSGDPVRGVYNHGWLIGDPTSISLAVQAQIDLALEISPVDRTPTP